MDNYFFYKLGRFYQWWNIFNPIIFILLIGYLIYLKSPQVSTIQISPAIVIENGQVSRLACFSEDEGFKSVAINLSGTLAQILYGFSSDVSYSAKTAAFGNNFDETTEFAAKFHDLVVKNMDDAKQGRSAQFIVDKNSLKAGPVPANPSLYVVILSGTQIIQTKVGTNSFNRTMSITFKFNLNRGQDGKIYKIIRFNPDFNGV